MSRDSHLFDILRSKSLDGVLSKYVNVDDEGEVKKFLRSLSMINLDNVILLRHLLRSEMKSIDLSNLKAVPFSRSCPYDECKQFQLIGAEAIKNSKIAFLVFSGGAATRLKEQYPELRELYIKKFGMDIGNDSSIPKGILPISPLGYYTFIRLFAEQVLRLQYEYNSIVNLIIMVSSLTENYVRKYFEENNYFGLMRRAVFFLLQQENPRLDPDGDMIFDGEKIVTTGDGHGGVYRALIESHLRDELIIRGVEAIAMFNVDNPLARFFDPCRIGYHFSKGSDFTISVVEKTEPDEKIGVVVEDVSTYRVIEYNMLDSKMRNVRNEEGELLFSCGHINNNITNLAIIDKKFSPIVYKNKKIRIKDREIYTSSLEWLNQDIVTVINKSRVSLIGLKREEFFLPTKNVTGVDSIETTVRGLNHYYKSIVDNSCKFYNGSILDVSPSFILDRRDDYRLRNLIMEEDSRLFIGACVDINDNLLVINKGLILERGASLRINSEKPFGDFEYDYVTNTARPNLRFASKLNIKKPLRIKAGSNISIFIKGGGVLMINSGELSGNISLIVEKEQKVEL
ncbi:MAG: UTP--glucose-1-phosphate uridylyltransferase [Deltaproteobacteria bacterium]|nr:UTP--glucose-1-phosphate uridylyltransferase [Deltaproteobacteria bacterium]